MRKSKSSLNICVDTSICSFQRWYLQYGNGTEPYVVFSIYTLVGSMFAVGLAFGIIVSVGILFIVQIKSIIRNRTGIEDWIEQKVR